MNTHHLGEQIVKHLDGSEVAVSDESDLLLETGGGLRRALHLLGTDPVITMNPDVVWTGPNPVAELRAAWDGAGRGLTDPVTGGSAATGHERFASRRRSRMPTSTPPSCR